MCRIALSFTKPGLVTIVVMCALALLGMPEAAQAQQGRLLFSPRGDVIIECNTDGSNCFSVVGGDPTHPVSGAREPSVAVNGTIAFEAVWDDDGTCVVGGQGICWTHIFLMDANGDNVRQLTFNPPNPQDASAYGGDKNAAISPDGTMVAFISNRTPAYDANNVPNYMDQIYVVNTDGTGLRQITQPAYDSSGNPHGRMRTLAWSPDGSKLAFSGNVYTTICGTYFGNPIDVGLVGALSIVGSAAPPDYVCLGDNGGAIAVDWSPDGSLIAYGRESSLGEPAIAFIDLSGQGRFAAGLTSAQLGTRCTDGPHHCFHFSPDNAQLVYENQSLNTISRINLDGTSRSDFANVWSGIPNQGIWWAAGAAIPAPAQLVLTPDPVEVWPGSAQQLVPDLLDAGSQSIFHAAASYSVSVDYGTSGCITIGPFGLAFYTGGGTGSGSITASNAGATSNSVLFRCWASPPCTFALTPSSENFSGNGGSDSVGVTVTSSTSASGCPWTATSNAPWITITSGANGSGNGNVSFTVAANTGVARQSTLTIAGETFTVTQDQAGAAQLRSISVSPATASIPAGYSQQFTATGHYGDGSIQDLTTSVTWASSNASVSTISNTPGSQGLASGVASGGPITITAALQGSSGTAQLTVTAPLLVSLAVSPANPSVPSGSTQQFAATGTYSDGSVQTITGSVTWTSSNTAVATINAAGLASSFAAGATTISARQGSVTGSTTMTVITLQSLTIGPLMPSLVVGSTLQFAATGHYSDGSTRDLTSTAAWSSSKVSIATITSPGGLATAVAKGSTTIRAVAGGLSASTTLTVSVLTLRSITVTPANATISVGGTQQFTAIGTYNNGSTSDITNSVMWSSSPKMVASISAGGLANGLKAGVATITAKSGGTSATASLTVR